MGARNIIEIAQAADATIAGLDGGFLPSTPGPSSAISTYLLNASSPAWHLAATGGPHERSGMAMSNDPKDGYIVMTGGWSLHSWSAPFNDTWTYASGHWKNITTHPRPAPTLYGSMTYDRKDGYVLLFGGCVLYLGCAPWTWTFTGGNWTRLLPNPSPPASLMGAGMTYDAKDGYVVLFGGSQAGCNGSCSFDTNYTWTYAGGVWTNITSSIAPSPRYGPGMAYDARDGFVLLHGGGTRIGCTGTCVLGDTWKFVGGNWTKLWPAKSPSPRSMAGMTYDARLGYVVLYGGDAAGLPLNDTWSFVHGAWTKIAPAKSPTAVYYMVSSYSSGGGAMAVYESPQVGSLWLSTMWLLF